MFDRNKTVEFARFYERAPITYITSVVPLGVSSVRCVRRERARHDAGAGEQVKHPATLCARQLLDVRHQLALVAQVGEQVSICWCTKSSPRSRLRAMGRFVLLLLRPYL